MGAETLRFRVIAITIVVSRSGQIQTGYRRCCCLLFEILFNAIFAVSSIKIGYEKVIRPEAMLVFGHVNAKSQRRPLAVVAFPRPCSMEKNV